MSIVTGTPFFIKNTSRIFFILLFIFTFSMADAQKRLLENETILFEIKKCLSSTYNYTFGDARTALVNIEQYSPGHPAVQFLKAFILYWENYPLIPGHPKEASFLKELEDCIRNSEAWVKNEPEELEAIFFDLFSRAFYVMYWADNGKPGKVFPHINTLYHHTMQGFDRKDDFTEFYFTTGLYNFYVEAYPEKHPAYKPVVAFFKKGDRTAGIDQLKYCADNSVFLRVEARFFLSLLHLNYETDLETASMHAAQLYKEFPNNSFYAGKYLEILLANKKFFFAPLILEKLKSWQEPFSQMQYYLYHAYYLEKVEKDKEKAKKEYNTALEISEKFGEYTRHYNAIAYMGLGRYYNSTGNSSLANRFFRKAKSLTSYDYILDDR